MDRSTFEDFRTLVRRSTGISLGANKEVLLNARISKRMRALGLEDPSAYLDRVVGDSSGRELSLLVDAVSTNVTSFFREDAHFDVIEDLIRASRTRGVTRLRFWSAACSTGEEAYSLAMVVREASAPLGMDVRILATDISQAALTEARSATYEHRRVDSVPPALLAKYFKRDREGLYHIKPAVASHVTFARLNLSRPPFPMSGPFDVIMCRNVMIYFENETRRALIGEFERLLSPGGLMILGHAESLTGVSKAFRPIQASVYAKE